jgi:hypothetical protein
MSRHTFTLAGALAGCLIFAPTPQASPALPTVSKAASASGAVILAKRECIAYEYRDGRRVCVRWNDCKPGDTVC